MAAVFGITGCGPSNSGGGGGGNQSADPDKTQLSIGVYDGGLGSDWTRAVADEFEKMYANVSFEEGKMGVQVMIYGKGEKANYEPSVLIPNIQNKIATDDVYLTANSALYQFINAGICEDITDTLTEKVYAENGELATGDEEKKLSILDKMDNYFVESYKQSDGKYYAFPFEDSVFGIVYDADLFEKKGWKVPSTMSEFYALLDKMTKSNVTPFTWTGSNDFYFTPITTAIVAQYEGIAGADQNLFYNGTFHGTEITEQNGYLLAGQQGKLEALKFLRQITSNTRYYSSMAFGGSQGHLDAQAEYILSIEKAANGGGNRIAMILEGEWWENEARGTFNEMGSSDEDMGYGKRNFKLMPMPTIDGQKSDKKVLASFSNGSVAFINKNSTKKELAKLWIQFMHQNSSLATFTTYTGSVLPYSYTLSDEQYNSMTPFARSVWDLRHDENVVIYRTSNKSNFARFAEITVGGVGSEIETETMTTSALRTFYLNPTLTAEQYFESSKEYYQNNWAASYNKYKG
ncbi:MAG: ABC transporter substrate-binding protein [Eubacteriales bacterium]